VASGGAGLRLENTIVASNGGNSTATGGIVLDGSTAEILYSTIAANDSSSGNEARASMYCTNSTVNIRNSIMGNESGTSIECGTATVLDSYLDTSIGAIVGQSVLNAYFTNLTNNFRPVGAGIDAFTDVASWRLGDPATDFAGVARPTVDNTADVAGALLP